MSRLALLTVLLAAVGCGSELESPGGSSGTSGATSNGGVGVAGVGGSMGGAAAASSAGASGLVGGGGAGGPSGGSGSNAGGDASNGGAGSPAGGASAGAMIGPAGGSNAGAGGMPGAGASGMPGGAGAAGGAGVGGGPAGGSAGSAALSFATDIWPVFAKTRDPVFVYPGAGSFESCLANGVCHGGSSPGAGLDMTDAATAYSMLVDVISSSTLCARTLRVAPGVPEESCLILFYEGRLRDELDWVDTNEIDLMRTWIAQGARP